jgi:hypothetical protein
MKIEDALRRYFDDPHGAMPAELEEAMAGIDTTDRIEQAIASVARAKASVGDTSRPRPSLPVSALYLETPTKKGRPE